MEPNPSFTSELLAYGNWSGPGYSNGFTFQTQLFTDSDRSVFGVDAYDNYVAKAHDLNEINASEALRQSLSSIGIPSLAVLADTAPDGNYTDEFELRAALSDPPFRSC